MNPSLQNSAGNRNQNFGSNKKSRNEIPDETNGGSSVISSKQSDYNFTKPYSDTTAETIDAEVRNLIEGAYKRTLELLRDKRDKLEILAKELLEKEIIFQTDLERLIGKRPFEHQTSYEAFTNSVNGKEIEEKPETEEIKNEEDAAPETVSSSVDKESDKGDN